MFDVILLDSMAPVYELVDRLLLNTLETSFYSISVSLYSNSSVSVSRFNVTVHTGKKMRRNYAVTEINQCCLLANNILASTGHLQVCCLL